MNRDRMGSLAWAVLGLAVAVSTVDLRGDEGAYRGAVTSEPSLIGYYPFDGDIGPVVHDVHAWGNSNLTHNGTLTGAAALGASARIGCQALRPGGGRVDLGRVADYEFTDGTGTVEAWVYQSTNTTYNPCLFSCRDPQRTRYSLHGDAQGKRLWFWNGTKSLAFVIPTSTASMIGRWAHVAFVFTNGTVTAYLDGNSLGTQSAALGQNSGLPLQIGASSPGNTESWPGWIDELALLSAPLTAVQIQQQYGGYMGPPASSPLLSSSDLNSSERYACSLGQQRPAVSSGNLDGPSRLWWIWQAPTNGWVLATAGGTSCVGVDLRVEEVDTNDFSRATSLGTNSGATHYGVAMRSAVLFLAQAGRFYRLGVSPGPYAFPSSYGDPLCDPGHPTWNGMYPDDFRHDAYKCDLRVEQTPAPVNDSAANATRVVGEFPAVRGSNWGATPETGDPGGLPGLTGATVWWRWTAPTQREVTLSTRGSDIHTLLAVYGYVPGPFPGVPGYWTKVVQNGLAPEFERATNIGPFEITQTMSPPSLPFPAADVLARTSRVRFQAQKGAEYLIAVDGIRFADGAAGMGDIHLNWEGITIEAFTENSARTNADRSLAIQGAITLVNRGVASSGSLRLRAIGTRIYPGTARTNRDPGRQETPEKGSNLTTNSVGVLGLGASRPISLAFTIPAPDRGIVTICEPPCQFLPGDPEYEEFCCDHIPFTGSAHAWRAGVMIEVDAGALGWKPVAYYPLRHGPWPEGPIYVKDGSGPYDGAGSTGEGGFSQQSASLQVVNPPPSLVAGQRTNLHGLYINYTDGEPETSTVVDNQLRLTRVAGPGHIEGERIIVADATSVEADLQVEASYVSEKATRATTNVVIRVIPGPNQPPVVQYPITSPQIWSYGASVSYQFPANTFHDPESGPLTYTAPGTLPPGLTFYPTTRTFSGKPTKTGDFSVQVIASDSGSPKLTATNTFTLRIEKAALTVTAEAKTKTYGAPDPEFTVNYVGFANGETNTVLGGKLSFSRVPGEQAGDYAITPSGLTSANYAITYKSGTLTIGSHLPVLLAIKLTDPARAMITWGAVSNVKYGVQYAAEVDATNWFDLPGDITIDTGAASKTDPLTPTNRFYRVRVLP